MLQLTQQPVAGVEDFHETTISRPTQQPVAGKEDFHETTISRP